MSDVWLYLRSLAVSLPSLSFSCCFFSLLSLPVGLFAFYRRLSFSLVSFAVSLSSLDCCLSIFIAVYPSFLDCSLSALRRHTHLLILVGTIRDTAFALFLPQTLRRSLLLPHTHDFIPKHRHTEPSISSRRCRSAAYRCLVASWAKHSAT